MCPVRPVGPILDVDIAMVSVKFARQPINISPYLFIDYI
jgi:hypothetical protein